MREGGGQIGLQGHVSAGAVFSLVSLLFLFLCDCATLGSQSTGADVAAGTPLQAWMSSRGPLLQQMAVQQHLWGEVAATVLVRVA